MSAKDRKLRQKKRELVKHIWRSGFKYCPDCERRMFFPSRDKIKDFSARFKITRKTIFARTISLEHLIPRSFGGSDNFNNLTIVCASCNTLRDNKFLVTKILPIHIMEE